MALVPRSDKSVITATVGDLDIGSCVTFDGGAADSEEVKTRPGGGQEEVSLGGPSTQDNVSVTKLYNQFMRDNREAIEGLRGKAKMVVKVQPLDGDDNPYGSPDVYRGKFKRFEPPARDVNGSEAAFCTLEMTTGRVDY